MNQNFDTPPFSFGPPAFPFSSWKMKKGCATIATHPFGLLITKKAFGPSHTSLPATYTKYVRRGLP